MTMSEAVELEPCPFCGGKARTFGRPSWGVVCEPGARPPGCGAQVGGFDERLTELQYATQAEASAAWNRRSLTGEGEPVGRVDRPALDIPALQREVAEIIVHDVLQEEYDDLVEGYLDEIMRASLRIIRLPGYSVVARAFETNLADALISASGGGE